VLEETQCKNTTSSLKSSPSQQQEYASGNTEHVTWGKKDCIGGNTTL